jgi:DNA-binding GntR family transcriptional regulator
VAIPHKEKLSDLAYQAIKEMIVDHRFQPGARINIEKLTKELGVSRTPVWEAVSRLEQEGLVKNVPNRGVYMIELTLADTLHLYQVREVLESLAARLAAERIDDETLARMSANLREQVEVVEAGDLMGYSRLDFDFHAAVYSASGNPYLQDTLEVIKNKMRPLAMRLQPILGDLHSDHVLLYEALLARDPVKAEEAFRGHNQFIVQHIRQAIAEGDWQQQEESG